MADSPIALGPTQVATNPREQSAGVRLDPGAKAGDYVIDRFVGAGAMGEVYAGNHPEIGKRVAIKVLKQSLLASPEAVERFKREARAGNQVDHPNVIDVFAFGSLDDGRLYLVMDLVEGRTLRRLVEDGPLSVATTLDILGQIADALDAAHARGVVHRDLKPDNVMIAASGKVAVLDFGIAKLVAQGAAMTGNGTLTGQGQWLGTPGYMAPEQWSADGAGPASDRYALGVMAYELLSGKLPFQAPTLPQMMEQHFRAPVPSLSVRYRVAAHAKLDPVLAKAMAKDPDARFSTARALVDALRAAAGGKTVRGLASPGRKAWVPAAIGSGVLAAGVVAVLVIGPTGTRPSSRAAGGNAPPTGFVKLDIRSIPLGAKVMRGDKLLGRTQLEYEAKLGEGVELAVVKPGYTTAHHSLIASDSDQPIEIRLVPQNGFEGVWMLPDGQLRAFARAGEQVDVFKQASLTGQREFYRKFQIEESPSQDLLFAANETITDARAAHEASCQIAVRVEYHYDPVADQLDVRPEKVKTALEDGRCVVIDRRSVPPIKLTRVDAGTGETRETRAPVGIPADTPELTQVGEDAPFEKGNVKKTNGDAAKKAEEAKLQALRERKAKDQALNLAKKLPPPRQTKQPPKQAPNDDIQQRDVAGDGSNAPPQQAPQPPPQQNAPQLNAPATPQVRGDSQVAPQFPAPDTDAQQQRVTPQQRKK